MQELLINLSTHHAIWVYIVVAILACVEGPVLSMIFGVLIKLNYFEFFPIYLALMLGDVMGDSFLYFIGHNYGHSFIKKFGKYFSLTEDRVSLVMRIFNKYKYRILIISKLTNGFGLSIAVLISAGMARIPFLKYLASNLIGQFVWSGLLIGVGYFFSHAYLTVNNILGKISIIVLFIVVIIAFLGFVKYLRTKSEEL